MKAVMQLEKSTQEDVSLILGTSLPSFVILDPNSGDVLQIGWAYTGLGIATLCLIVILITLSWCVFRQRRDHLKTERSANDSRQMKGCAKVNSACYDLPDKSTPPSLEDVDGRGEGPVMGQRQVAREVLDSSSCCCCCCCTYNPAGEPIIASANSFPSIGESCLKAIQVPSDLIVSTEEAPKPLEYCERLHLTLASASLPASPAIPPIETHPFQVQPPPILARRVIELGQQRANLMESFCSAGDIQQANREESSVAVCYNDEPPKAKNRSLLELRRGPRAALVLNLHIGASSNFSPLRKVLLGEMNAASEEDNRLLFAEHPLTSYSTFGHESSLCLASDETLTVQPPTALAVAATVAANLSPRPKTGEEPSRIADRVALRTASLLLTPEALEAKLGQGGEDSLYKEFWDIPMNFANKADCPWVGVSQKNRYHEVLPHNNTRVVLPAINNDDMTSYINANYIHGYQGRPRAFIATQGPMSHTINDFWRMVWHTRAPAVVMLTKICEQDKRSKCELYLPTLKHESIDRAINTPVRADTVPAAEVLATAGKSTEDDETAAWTSCGLLQSAASLPTSTLACWGEEFSRICSPVGAQRTFGNIHVRVIAVTQKESYTERKLILSLDGEDRQVTHFWYIGWSDHSSPEATLESARSLLDLVHETEACRNRNGGSSLPSTPALTLVPNSTAVLPPASTRLLSRQAAEEWSDADFDLHFPTDVSHEESSPVTALNFFFLSESEASAPNPLGPSSRACRASDPAPMAATGAAAVGPVVVHCSAGVGRTGCFIALCIGCEQLRKENKVDVLGIVSRLRLDRGGMVENSEQYTFLHAALCMYNAIRSGRELPILPAITNLRNQFTGPLR